MRKTEKNAKKWLFLDFVIFTILAAEGAIFGVQRWLNAWNTQEEYIFVLRTEIIGLGVSIRVLYGPKVDYTWKNRPFFIFGTP